MVGLHLCRRVQARRWAPRIARTQTPRRDWALYNTSLSSQIQDDLGYPQFGEWSNEYRSRTVGLPTLGNLVSQLKKRPAREQNHTLTLRTPVSRSASEKQPGASSRGAGQSHSKAQRARQKAAVTKAAASWPPLIGYQRARARQFPCVIGKTLVGDVWHSAAVLRLASGAKQCCISQQRNCLLLLRYSACIVFHSPGARRPGTLRSGSVGEIPQNKNRGGFGA